MAALGLIGTVASTGLQMYGQHQQAQAAEAAAKYNNDLAEQEARNTEMQTAEGIKRQRINNRAGLAGLRARMAAGGIQASTGTPLMIMGETAGRLEVEIADAARAANMQAASMRARGRMGLWEADQVGAAAKMNMFATGVSGAMSAFGTYQENKNLGVNYRIGS